MYTRHCLGVLLLLCAIHIALSAVIEGNSLPIHEEVVSVPSSGSANTVYHHGYPGWVPPGYSYHRRIRVSGNPYWNYPQPQGYVYRRRIRTSGYPHVVTNPGGTSGYPHVVTNPGGYFYKRTYRYNNGADQMYPVMSVEGITQ